MKNNPSTKNKNGYRKITNNQTNLFYSFADYICLKTEITIDRKSIFCDLKNVWKESYQFPDPTMQTLYLAAMIIADRKARCVAREIKCCSDVYETADWS